MQFKLHKRKTDTHLHDGGRYDEEHCIFCHASDTAEPIGNMTPNKQGFVDENGCAMYDQQVKCQRCVAEWVDIWRRIYPDGGS